MRIRLIIISLLLLCGVSAYGAILVFNPNGTYTVKSTLSAAATAADAAGKTVVITTALNSVQSNISSATVHGWPSDRALRVEKGGSIGNTTTFRINGSYIGPLSAFTGGGSVIFGQNTFNWMGGLNTENGVARYVLGLGPNTSADNSLGRLQVYSEIAPGPAIAQGYPLGNDLALITKGPADLTLNNVPHDVTCAATVSPGAQTLTVTSTAQMSDLVTLIVEPGGANEEYVVPANWAIVNGTQISITLAKSHTGPFTIRQQGAIFVNSFRTIYNNPLDAHWFYDQNINPSLGLPNTSLAFPKDAFQFYRLLTGANGANKDLLVRLNGAASSVQIIKSDNSGVLFAITDNYAQFNVPLQSRKIVSILSYSASINIDAGAASIFEVLVTNANAFTINNPTNAASGQEITIQIGNGTAGALGAVTWGSLYRLSTWTQPATGTVKIITFYWDGTKWYEKSRTADVPG